MRVVVKDKSILLTGNATRKHSRNLQIGYLSFGAPTPVKYSIILITTPVEEVLEQCAKVVVIRLSIEGESPSVKKKSAELVRNAGTQLSNA